MPKDKDIKFGCGEYFTIHWKTRTCGHDNELCPSCTKAFQQVRELIKQQGKLYEKVFTQGNWTMSGFIVVEELLEQLPKVETK